MFRSPHLARLKGSEIRKDFVFKSNFMKFSTSYYRTTNFHINIVYIYTHTLELCYSIQDTSLAWIMST